MKSLNACCFLLAFAASEACSQPAAAPHVGGACEGCEAIYECPVSFDRLNAVDTLPDYSNKGPKLIITGTVYGVDGKTPAPNVVVYIYHTNQEGIYQHGPDAKGWEKRHGQLRGWIKTDRLGHYQFFTLRPAPYPGRQDPAHIHIIIKEPDKNEYWIDEFLFTDDTLLKNIAHPNRLRGGNGVVTPVRTDAGWQVTRNIILGMNVTGYPKAKNMALKSGLPVGSNCPAFDPLHLSGPDSGTHACPMCKYGYQQGIMLWVNHARPDQLLPVALRFDQEMALRGVSRLRVFMICIGVSGDDTSIRAWKEWASRHRLRKLALLWVPGPEDPATAALYRINPEARNTNIVYRHRNVVANLVNVELNNQTADRLLKILKP